MTTTMTTIEIVHRIKQAASNASYVGQTPGYDHKSLERELEALEDLANKLIAKREQGEL